MMTPNFLVQTTDGVLHGYWDAVLLKMDLALQSSVGCKLYRRLATAGKVSYLPMTHDQFKALSETQTPANNGGWGWGL